MNPDPVIVTGVSGEPATVDEGVVEVMAGVGFEVGEGFVGAEAPPPQPVMKKIQTRTGAKNTHVARFMGWSRVERRMRRSRGNRHHHTYLYSVHKHFITDASGQQQGLTIIISDL
jgi:hypothetical protein